MRYNLKNYNEHDYSENVKYELEIDLGIIRNVILKGHQYMRS